MYEEHFNLSHAPFLLSPDLDIFYASSGHKKAYSYLEFGIGKKEGFIVVTGDIGAGKTTLIEHLFANLDDDDLITVRLSSSQFNSADMLTLVAFGLGLEKQPNSKAETTLLINSFLSHCIKENKRVLIVVDEAQNIPIDALEELRMITNYHIRGISPVQIFLLGQPEFRDTLNSANLEQLRQRVVARYHLGPLNEDEVKEYILYRLNSVSLDEGSRTIFEEDTFSTIFNTTGGIPRIINTLCDRTLMYSYLEDKETISLEDLNNVIDELKDERFHGTPNPEEELELKPKYQPIINDVDFLI